MAAQYFVTCEFLLDFFSIWLIETFPQVVAIEFSYI